MSEQGKPTQPPASAPTSSSEKTAPPVAKPASSPPASPNLPAERKYIEVKVGDYVEFRVRRPDGDVWKIGRVTSLNRDFTDIMPIDSERIYCSHKEFIRKVLTQQEVATLPTSANWFMERS